MNLISTFFARKLYMNFEPHFVSAYILMEFVYNVAYYY